MEKLLDLPPGSPFENANPIASVQQGAVTSSVDLSPALL